MSNIFEKTMTSCLESRRLVESKNSKNKKNLTESVKKIKPLTEADEMDLTTNNYDNPDMDTMEDIADDVVVIVDPELDEDEVTSNAEKAQEIVDETPDGEVPSTDEHIGDTTYTCPICGNTFFSETKMEDGAECPVCGEFPSSFVLVGEVAEADTVEDTPEEVTDDVPAEDVADVPADEEQLTPDEDNEELECLDKEKKLLGKKRVMVPNNESYSIDEKTFNPFMNKFIHENYKNAESFVITGANLNKKILTLECKITFKSGKSKDVKLTTEGFIPFNGKRALIDFKEDGAFKTESTSKKSPFIFTTSMNKNIIRCEGLQYDFTTDHIVEGKSTKIGIRGNLVRKKAENKSVPTKKS